MTSASIVCVCVCVYYSCPVVVPLFTTSVCGSTRSKAHADKLCSVHCDSHMLPTCHSCDSELCPRAGNVFTPVGEAIEDEAPKCAFISIMHVFSHRAHNSPVIAFLSWLQNWARRGRGTPWYPPLVETRHLNPNVNTVPMATTTPDQNTWNFLPGE